MSHASSHMVCAEKDEAFYVTDEFDCMRFDGHGLRLFDAFREDRFRRPPRRRTNPGRSVGRY